MSDGPESPYATHRRAVADSLSKTDDEILAGLMRRLLVEGRGWHELIDGQLWIDDMVELTLEERPVVARLLGERKL